MLKFGVSAVAVIATADMLYLYYVLRKNLIARTPINEVAFVMSDALPCCKHTENTETVKKCTNPHCKAKLSNKIIEHIDSSKHLICIAM